MMRSTKIAVSAVSSLGLLATATLAAGSFSDVPVGHWAESSIEWANEQGIMTGPGNMPGRFDPDGLVNRAQLATTLSRFYLRYTERIQVLENKVTVLENTMEEIQDRMDESDSGISTSASFSASLNGQNEVPFVSTLGQGIGSFRLRDNDLTYTISVQGLSGPITAAHFHRGRVGVSGSVIEEIDFDGTQASGTWTNLSDEELDALFDGDLYVNVHTSKYANGEIRGQVNVKGTVNRSSSSRSSSSRSSSSRSSSSSSMSSSSSSSFSSSSSSMSSSSSSSSSI